MGAPNLIADTMDCGLSYSVISYLKKLSQQVSHFQAVKEVLWCLLIVMKCRDQTKRHKR